MSRIKITDSPSDIVVNMVEGNPGALSVCVQLLEKGKEIDPTAAMGEINSILLLDTFEIYGSRIWMLYKDFCGEDIFKTVAAIRACQLGIISRDQLNQAIDHWGDGLDIDEILVAVQERLPEFWKGEEEYRAKS